jgi:fucose permease
LSGTAAVAGSALISSIGIASGIIIPWVIGLIKAHSGSMDNASYLLIALLIAGDVALLPGLSEEKKVN